MALYDNAPNMGMNYGTLAQLSRPQMMPAAPDGAGPQAGWMYGMDSARHDQALARAAQMAQMDAAMRAQQAEEFSLAGPGRVANIQAGNILAEGNLQDAPNRAALGQLDTQAKTGRLNREMIEAEKKKLEKYAARYLNSDAEGKQEIVQEMEADGVKVGRRTPTEIAQAGRMDQLMQSVMKGAVHTPEFEQKRLLEKDKADAAERRTRITTEAKKWVAERSGQLRAQLQKEKPNRLEDPNRVIFYKLMGEANGDPEKEKAASEWYQSVSIAPQAARAANQPQQFDINPQEGTATPRQPQVPAPVKPPLGGEQKGSIPAAAVEKYKKLIANPPAGYTKEMVQQDFIKKFGKLPE